ncbi:BRCA1-associated protein-like isoform X2 [Durio zibethinus]|uniref:BRCA1-associated protein-like isoform X2 n=1 Tax=Durio zibethinus TaxID=66656 RepID=A0A6P5WH64_DURZI|nr:BRCA1-associated protein-like isoform X2 [Durio zibethinus]
MSSSSSTVTGDEKLRQSEAAISGNLTAPNMSTEAIPFSSGNPRIEETRGVMHLFSNDAVSTLPVERKPLVCVLGVPNHMTYADFCQFCASFIHHILEMRIVRNDGMEDRYSVLIRFDSQDSTDKFCRHFNNRQFNSLEEEACRVLFTVDVQFTGYTGSVDHVQSPPASSTEQPSCPVCLERLDQEASGILTTICNHSFHCSCISKWTDSSCPVCRYCQQQPEKSTCFICQTSENLWICVICGFVGCGRYKGGHAIIHWKETQHCYSLELETQRVWDYVGNNYVHRLIQSKTDGKLVELNSHCLHANDGCGSCDCVDSGISEAFLSCEAEIVNEYNELLRTQLENQKFYFESLLQQDNEETERAIADAVNKAAMQKRQKIQAKLERCVKEKKFLEDLNENLLKNQEIWKAKLLEAEEREKKALRMKDEKIQALEEQLRDLMAQLEAGQTVEQLSISNEINDSTVLPISAEHSLVKEEKDPKNETSS